MIFLAGCASGGTNAPPPPPPPRPAPPLNAPLAGPAARKVEPAPPADSAPAPAPDEGSGSPASADPPAQSEPSPPASDPGPRPVGWIAGQPLAAEELLVEWSDAASRELWLVLDKLVAARLAMAEADRLGLRLDPGAVEQRLAEERKKLEEQLSRSAKGRSFEEFVAKDLGLEPARYLERVRAATIRQMLAERAVRAHSLQSESVSLRLIVVPDEQRLEEVQDELASGAAFADVAREHSVDDTKTRGGLVPFVVAQERSPLARLAFQTPVGETAGPLAVADHLFLIRVEERRAPLEGDWPAIQEAVLASLAENPVADAEFLNWKLAMEARYPIDLGALWKLLGAAR